MDADGANDLVAAGRFVGKVAILLNDNAGGFQTPAEVDVGVAPTGLLHLVDLNGDSALDIITASGSERLVLVLLADPTGATRFTRPPGDFSTLSKRPLGGFTRTSPDGITLEYDALGRQTARIDRNGNTTRLFYDAENRLTKQADPSASTPGEPACNTRGVTCYVYVNGRLETLIDPTGRVTRYLYDARGNLTDVTQVDASVRRLAYDENRRLISEASERGFVTTHDYGFAGQWTGSSFPDGASISAQISKSLGLADLGLGIGTDTSPAPYAVPNGETTVQDAKGNPFTMKFNEFSSVIEIFDPISRTTTLTRDADNQVIQVVKENDGELPDGTVPATVTTQIDYDALGNVTAQREAAGTTLQRETRFFYQPGTDRVTKIVDPTNALANPPCGTAGVTCFVHDATGNVKETIDATNVSSTRDYLDLNCPGLMTSSTTAFGLPEAATTGFEYDPLTCNLAKIVDAEGFETDFDNDPQGRVTARTEGLVNGLPTPEARTTSFTYDDMNRVLTETDGTGATTTKRYDAASNEIETMDATDVVVARAYDERDRLIMKGDPTRGQATQTYDKNGNLESVKNALNNSVTLFYDSVNRLEKATDPLLKDRLFTYDAQDNLKTVTDARQVALGSGLSTTFVYDLLGRNIRRTNPLGETSRFEFDSRDNLEVTIDAKNQRIERLYDDLSRLTTVTTKMTDGVTIEDTVTFTYDANGNRKTAADNDSSLAFTYDTLNRVKTAETLADLGTVQPPVLLTSDYDAVANRTQFQATEGPAIVGTWTHGYDAAGRLTSLVSPAGDPLNPITLGYDAAGRLARIDFPSGVTSQVTYDLLTGRLENIAHTKGQLDLASFGYTTFADGLIETITEAAGTRRFTYDDTQQLLTGGIGGTTESYQYDEEGNRTLSHLSISHSHDDANRLREDDSFCYTYDANGNLETKTVKVAGSCLGNPTTTYVWDVRNRLVRIDFPDLTSAAYRYDADGRRIEKGVNGAITRYLYDDDDIILEYDGTNTLAAKYSHGIEVDQPLVQERGGQSFFYHVDHLGSVRKLTNAAGAITNTYDTEAFGRFETRLEAVANPYTFTAREFDPESGLHFYRARYYDPFAGRFLGADPIGFNSRDLNLYRYVYNDPINFVDPFGEAAAIERCLLGGVAGAIAESLAFVGARAGGVFALIAAVLDPNAANVLPPTNEVGGEAAVGFFAGCLIGLANPATVPREAIIHEGFLIGLALGVIKGSK